MCTFLNVLFQLFPSQLRLFDLSFKLKAKTKENTSDKETVYRIERVLKDALTYTEYFAEAMVFNDIVAVHRYIEKHGLEKLATVIKA